jgi:hypothetical protein
MVKGISDTQIRKAAAVDFHSQKSSQLFILVAKKIFSLLSKNLQWKTKNALMALKRFWRYPGTQPRQGAALFPGSHS